MHVREDVGDVSEAFASEGRAWVDQLDRHERDQVQRQAFRTLLSTRGLLLYRQALLSGRGPCVRGVVRTALWQE